MKNRHLFPSVQFPKQVALVSLITFSMIHSATAASGTWSGPSTGGSWDTTATTWTGVTDTPWDAANGPSNTATFNTGSLMVTVAGPVFTNGITFSTSGALSASTINLVGTTPGISVASGQTGTISSIIAGSAGLIKSDGGLLTLSGANTYTGGTTVNGGRLTLVNNATGSSNFINNSELEFNITSGTLNLNGGTVSGTGNFIKTGNSQMQLGAQNSGQTIALTGASTIIDVQGGSLRNEWNSSVWVNNKAGLRVASGATFDTWTVDTTVDELTGSGNINKGFSGIQTITIGVNNGDGTFTGTITNSSGIMNLVKRGSGTQILSGINTYAGATTIAAGTLQLSESGALSSSTAVSVASGATFDVGGRNQTIAGLSGAGAVTNASGVLTVNKASGLDTLSGVLSGGTGLTKTGAGGLSLAAVNTYSGATIVNGGVLGVRKNANTTITVAAAGGLALAVGSGATYYTAADVDLLWAGSLSGVTIDNASFVGIDTTASDVSYTTPNSNLSRGFAKLGINTLTLTGTNAYTGGTSVLGGILSFSRTAARPVTGTVTVGTGGGLALAVGGAGFFTTADVDSLWANTLSGVSLATSSTVGIDTAQGDLAYTTPATNSTRGFAKVGTGTLTLTGANAYTGGTFVGAGKLILQNTMTGGQNFVTNGELEFNLTSANQRLQGGSITGTGNLIKSGGSTLDLGNNNNPYTIALTGASSIIDVQGGILKNDWGNSAWTNNRAGLNIASGASFNLHDGNATVDELTGAGTVAKGISNAGILTIGVNDGTGTFSGTLSGSGLALLKLGAGTQTFSGSTSYNGGTTVNGGRLIFTNNKSGTSNFVTNAELEFNVTTGNQTLSGGTISGTGNLIKTGAGELWLGSFGPTAQTVALTGASSIIDVQGGTLRNEYGNSAWGSNKAGLTVASGAAFDIWDGNATVDELNGAGTINKGNASGPGTSTLTIGANDGSGTFSGGITQTSGTLSLVKTGTGAQILSGTNTYTGATSINTGKLVVGGSLGNTAVSVSNAGTILASDAAASIGGSLTINNAAILAVGDAANAATATAMVLGASTFNNGSIFSWDINGTGTAYDKLVTTAVAGEVASGDAVFRIVVADSAQTNSFWNTNQSWADVFTTDGSAGISDWASVFGNTVSVVNSSFTALDTSAKGTFTISGSSVTWTAVPEPTTALAGLLLTAGLLRRRRA